MANESGDIIYATSGSAASGNVIADDSSGVVGSLEGDNGEGFDPSEVIFATDSGSAASVNGNASSASAGTASNASGRKQRADKGQRRGSRKEKVPASVADFAGVLSAVHEMASAFLHCEEIALDDEEAKRIADASRKLADFYQVAPSAESLLWLNFTGALVSVYGPRGVAIFARKKREAAKAKMPVAPAKPTVVDFSAAFAPGGMGG